MTKKPEKLHLPFPIITPRLKIVPVHPDHAQAFYDAKVETMEDFYPWMMWSKDGPGTLDEQRAMMQKKHAEFVEGKELMMLAFTHDGEFVVSTGLHNVDWHVPMAEIGYWARKSAMGKGYVTEASNALVRYSFEALKMRKVEIAMDSENTASEAVPKRLNMVLEFERAGSVKTLHPAELGLRIERSYCCFDTKSLPALDVRWG